MGKLGDFFKKSRHLKYLKDNIADGMSLADILNVFEQMCQMPSADSMLLFETGTFAFNTRDTQMFFFSLVRQYPGVGDEYYQLHVDVMYEPTEENAAFSKSVWDMDLEGDFFQHIRSSAAFSWANKNSICKINVFMDKT